MKNIPFTFDLPAPDFVPSAYDHRTERTLSDMNGYYLDQCRLRGGAGGG